MMIRPHWWYAVMPTSVSFSGDDSKYDNKRYCSFSSPQDGDPILHLLTSLPLPWSRRFICFGLHRFSEDEY